MRLIVYLFGHKVIDRIYTYRQWLVSFLCDMGGSLIDSHKRVHRSLRISVVDKCDLRCTYCMPEDQLFLPKKDLLTLEEVDRLCSVFIEKGVRKLRLTGGEPLVRKNIMHLVRQISRHLDTGAHQEQTQTTNVSHSATFAAAIA